MRQNVINLHCPVQIKLLYTNQKQYMGANHWPAAAAPGFFTKRSQRAQDYNELST